MQDKTTKPFAQYGPFGHSELFFPREEYDRRLKAAGKILAEADVDTLITFSPSNIAYLCGHFSANIYDFQCLVVTQDGPPLLILWYFELARFHASAMIATAEAYDTGEDPIPFLVDTLKRKGLLSGRIGLDEGATGVPARVLRQLKAALPEDTVLLAGVIEAARLIKSELEIETLRRAADVTVAGVRAAIEAVGESVSDFDVAAASNRALYAAGTHFMALPPFICAGWRGGAPHSTPTGHVLKRGDSVFIEVGANVNRYTAPLMRTACVSKASDAVRKLVAISDECLHVLTDTIRAGVTAAQVAEAGTRVMRRIPADTIFHYTFGYPVGINFPPSWLEESNFLLLTSNPRPLEAGMVFHLPMSLRSYGQFGTGLSETILVTENGAELLTNMPRDLVIR